MGKVRYSGSKSGPPTFNTDGEWDPDDFHLFDPDYWKDPAGGAGLGREFGQALGDAGRWIGGIPAKIKNYWQFDPGDDRNILERYRDGFNVIRGASGALKEVYDATGQSEFAKRYWYIPDRPSQAVLGATILQGAGEAIWGIKNWRQNWGGEGNQAAPVTYQGNQGNQGGAYQYQPTPYVPAAGANLSNADRLRIQQENLIANRKAERLASMPAWMKDMANTPIYNQAAAPGQGAGGYYQAAPQQYLQQSQGRYYQAAGNPYAGRVPDNLKRGGQWEKRHNQAVMLRRAAMVARSKGGKG